MSRKRWGVLGSVGAVVVLGGAAVLLQGGGEQDTGPPGVTVERGSVVARALAVGALEPETEITVKSKVSGVVQRAFVDAGVHVQAGEPLFEIRPEPTPLELVEARRALEMREITEQTLRLERNRVEQLAARDVVSEQDLERVLGQHEEAALQLATARDRLELLETGRVSSEGISVESVVLSPITGYVLERLVEVGDPVVPLSSFQEGTVLMSMADMDRLVFRGTVDEIDVGRLVEGMPVEISVGALPGTLVRGSVTRISLKARTQESATVFPIEVAIEPIDEVRLRAGFSANAEIVLDERTDVLVIPERVVTFEGDSAWVELPGPGGGRERRAVVTGLSDAVQVEILEGLEEGDVVLEKPLRTVGG